MRRISRVPAAINFAARSLAKTPFGAPRNEAASLAAAGAVVAGAPWKSPGAHARALEAARGAEKPLWLTWPAQPGEPAACLQRRRRRRRPAPFPSASADSAAPTCVIVQKSLSPKKRRANKGASSRRLQKRLLAAAPAPPEPAETKAKASKPANAASVYHNELRAWRRRCCCCCCCYFGGARARQTKAGAGSGGVRASERTSRRPR